ncbi:Methylthioribose-1-phosphate isomerase [Nitrosopumilaceae archaeon]|nr:S-methyl-5-thioribose-1-phosphate isomerase [Nitrosopumilus sp.]MDA7945182.1 S-methyl-5-thioribose-1-phosphate isomerase [Nitrosopumilus sp.]MDA7955033.1 S-methyl-5-thioribose-1-phosphate isomerase [Nitrosopumilus sp.]MDA7974110.1 S-methyl-5-thioribose-1-phosphate isomerase [Nitrosopumilus sp.]CAI9832407.1 Methylthioribose-1-phosphate isomerase [Nitrosopumilaceae archaeon]
MEGLLTVRWDDGRVVMIDQTRLPGSLEFVEYSDHLQVADAIRGLVVRGAPAIGVAGALGLALAARNSTAATREALLDDIESARRILHGTRPTAVNLAWGLGRVADAARAAQDPASMREAAEAEAKRIADEDVRINRAMGRHGASLIGDGETVMTHCNAGALATVAYGTALGVIRAAREDGKKNRVVATETRPVQQGSRLTAFELQHDGFDVSLIPDTAVGYSMASGMVQKAVVGADRVLRTGHVFNKIGTYQVAVMAARHNIPFYVAAPLSTIDLESGVDDVVIEMRGAGEVTGTGGSRTAPEGIGVVNPAFDMTPPELVSGIITERGVARAPYEESLPALFGVIPS